MNGGQGVLAAMEQGIAVIAVKENTNKMANKLEDLPFGEDKLFIVDNYLEAVGVMTTLKAGVSLGAVRRPIAATKVVCEGLSQEKTKKTENAEIRG